MPNRHQGRVLCHADKRLLLCICDSERQSRKHIIRVIWLVRWRCDLINGLWHGHWKASTQPLHCIRTPLSHCSCCALRGTQSICVYLLEAVDLASSCKLLTICAWLQLAPASTMVCSRRSQRLVPVRSSPLSASLTVIAQSQTDACTCTMVLSRFALRTSRRIPIPATSTRHAGTASTSCATCARSRFRCAHLNQLMQLQISMLNAMHACALLAVQLNRTSLRSHLLGAVSWCCAQLVCYASWVAHHWHGAQRTSAWMRLTARHLEDVELS